MTGFDLTPISNITYSQPQNNWLIDGVIEKGSLAMIFGSPASGKSFMAMDMAFCIGGGIDWNGHPTTLGDVVYLAGEGLPGMARRFKALETHYAVSSNGIFVSNMPGRLSDVLHAKEIYQAIEHNCPNPALIIVDTLHRNFGDGDENSARDLNTLLSVLTAFINETGAAVLLVHHTGHASSGRARGSSALRASVDAEFRVEKRGTNITMSCTKAKDFEAGEPVSFELEEVALPGWLDANGEQMTSAVLKPSVFNPSAMRPPLSEKEERLLEILKNCTEESGNPAIEKHIDDQSDVTEKIWVNLADWRKAVYDELDDGKIQQGSMRQAFKRGREKLAAESKIIEIDDHVYYLG